MPDRTISSDYNRHFSIDGIVRLDRGNGDLPRIVVTTPLAQAHIYLLGAQVTHYKPADHAPILFMSGQSRFDVAKPLRGGVPVCFPWFDVRQNDPATPSSPNHGLVRTRTWRLESVIQNDDGAVQLTLTTASDDETRRAWPHDFALKHIITIGSTLTMTLGMRNTALTSCTFEEALHTYYAVGDIHAVQVRGLENMRFFSKVRSTMAVRDDKPMIFSSESDGVFTNTQASCVLTDPSMGRRIIIAKTDAKSTVVWNPWQNKAVAMEDFGDDEWTGMLCIETGNVGTDAITLPSGQSHTMSAHISVEHL